MLKTEKSLYRRASPKITSEIETITPEIAASYLDKNVNNRTPSKKIISSYARNMISKSWLLSGDAIRFDVNGSLIDGQHRLMACIEADTPFQTVVIYGLPVETKSVIDTNKVRKAADVLTMTGYTNTVRLSALASLILTTKSATAKTGSLRRKWTTMEIEECVSERPMMPKAINQTLGAIGCNPTAAAFCFYAGAEVLDEQDRAVAFLNVFKTGVPDYTGCPAHKLRERLIKGRGDNVQLNASAATDATIHAWNLFLEGTVVQQFKWPKDCQIKNLDLRKL